MVTLEGAWLDRTANRRRSCKAFHGPPLQSGRPLRKPDACSLIIPLDRRRWTVLGAWIQIRNVGDAGNRRIAERAE